MRESVPYFKTKALAVRKLKTKSERNNQKIIIGKSVEKKTVEN